MASGIAIIGINSHAGDTRGIAEHEDFQIGFPVLCVHRAAAEMLGARHRKCFNSSAGSSAITVRSESLPIHDRTRRHATTWWRPSTPSGEDVAR
jgi:hypothetical protein